MNENGNDCRGKGFFLHLVCAPSVTHCTALIEEEAPVCVFEIFALQEGSVWHGVSDIPNGLVGFKNECMALEAIASNYFHLPSGHGWDGVGRMSSTEFSKH